MQHPADLTCTCQAARRVHVTIIGSHKVRPLTVGRLQPRQPSKDDLAVCMTQADLGAPAGATAGERLRALAEARCEYRVLVGVQYVDTPFSVDKSLSLAPASALAPAVEAR